MAKWNVTAIIDASKYLGQVEADTQKEAEEKSWELEEAFPPTLCHQCAGNVDLGDIYKMQIEKEDEEEADNADGTETGD